MKSIEQLELNRKDFSEGLKELVTYAGNTEELSDKKSNKLLKYIENGLLMVRILDWVLDDEDLDFTKFCKKTKNNIAEEFGLNIPNQKEE